MCGPKTRLQRLGSHLDASSREGQQPPCEKAHEQPCSEAHGVKAEPLGSGLRPAMHPDLPGGPELSQEERTLQLPRPPGDAVPGGASTVAS